MNKKYAELDFPAWFDGKDVNEAAFCREFLSKNKLNFHRFTPTSKSSGPFTTTFMKCSMSRSGSRHNCAAAKPK